MRKFVHKQILELVDTVWEGIGYALSNSKEQSAIIVLQDCYVAIEQIENSLKQELSKERYLYYEEISNNIKNIIEDAVDSIINNKSISIIFKNIENKFNLIKKELISESEVKLEVVFMPYKSSMWDSLESIWRAAKEDKNCECYVIPIPYYDRNPDNSLGVFHYEGKEFPSYVPITHYSGYDLNLRKPDVIYIHNPYDGCNYVTSVHPNYYSYNLKENTDMLVYVPYFVVGGKVPEGHMQLPVFNYMDKMVVQSDKFKQVYKNVIPENKLVALGSPKIDRTVYFEKHKSEIPREWVDIIGNKKVVMYNTSISGILQHGIKAIEKMKYVFSIFKKQNDVILLWRPHPLIEATLKSMRFELFEEYIALKKQYTNEAVGIYDDTSDVTASISISDGYIGEASSSVVYLFGAVGKPIFLMDMEINKVPTEDEKASVSFLDCYFEDNVAWFVSGEYNALCKMNLSTGQVEVIDKVPGFVDFNFQYCDILKIDNKIIMQPFNAKEICEYDLQSKTFVKRPFKNPVAYGNFDRMIHYKDYVFMKPKSYSAILRYDLKNGDFKYYTECMKNFIEYQEVENEAMFIWGVCKRDNLLLMASSKVNQVLEFNMDTGESKIHIVGSKVSNYFGMAFDGSDYWLIPNESKAIVRWNYKTGKITEYSDFPENFLGDSRAFINIVCCGSYLLAFPRTANMIIKIDIATGKMSEFDLQLHYKEGERKSIYYKSESNYYFAKKIDDTHIVALSAYDNSLLIIDIETQKCYIKQCRLEIEDVNKLVDTSEKFGGISEVIPYASEENIYWTLEEFLNDAVVGEYKNKKIQKTAYTEVIKNMDGTCGEKIHHCIKEQLYNQ